MNKRTDEPVEIAALLMSASDLFGDTYDRLEEIAATLNNAITLNGSDGISAHEMARIARAAVRLARDGMGALGAAHERFSLEAERYGNDR